MKFKVSNLKDRELFYKNEFNIKKVASFFKKKPQLFAIDCGTETKIIKDKSKYKKIINLKPDINYKELKERLIYYLPEDVYYDRNVYKNPNKCLKFKNCFLCKNFLGQELAFDIDPENITCKKCGRKKFPKFCIHSLRIALEDSLNLYKELKKEFKKVKIVYSGRGYHIHVFDKRAYKLSIRERGNLNNKYIRYHIDPWVSYGKIRLIRLPYSLNSLVSRIVIPLKLKEIKKFNPLSNKKIIPKFLYSKPSSFS